jgi:HAD superfamily hydrolase (TIGR01549 family)
MKAIILDCHGILIERFPSKEYEEKVRKFLESKGLNFEELKGKYGTISWALEVNKDRDKYLKILDEMPVYEQLDAEMIDLLKELCNKYDLYIVTDTSKINLNKTLEASGIGKHFFKNIITGNDVKNPKPETEPYEKILEEGYEPEDVIVFGDRYTDIIPAQKLGMIGILCNYKQFKEVLKWML